MHTATRRGARSGGLHLAIGLSLVLFAAGAADAGTRAFVLTNGNLLSIDVSTPFVGGPTIAITGVTAGDTLVGIDFRPQNGHLYGLGYNSVAGTVTLYHISHRTGVATAIGLPVNFVAVDGTTPAPVQGTNFGFDFNPASDRVRVVDDAGQTFRLNPNTGGGVDGDTGSPGMQMDGAISGGPSGVDGAAYTNSRANVSVTTLYTLSAATNQMFIQNPPNSGTQTTPVTLTFNGATLDFTGASGFDIHPGVDVLTSNTVAAGEGYAALTVGGVARLYRVNLTTGVCLLSGPIGSGTVPIQGFALQADWLTGAPPIVAADAGNLYRFNGLFIPGAIVQAMSGLTAGEDLVGIDFRPETGQLLGLGINAAADTGTLYLIDPQTGAVSAIGSAGSIALVASDGTTPIDLPNPAIAGYGFDFNPTADRIRVVTNTGLNFRVNPNTGGSVDGNTGTPGTNPDGAVNGLPGGSTGLTASAYTNSFGQSLVGGTTTLYAMDPGSNKLFIQNPPNLGTVTLGLDIKENGTPIDFSDASFDIPGQVHVETSNAAATGKAYAILQVGGNTNFYSIDLATGDATLIAAGVFFSPIVGLAVGDGPPPATTTTILSSTNPALVTDTITFTANILPATAGGTVTFVLFQAGTPLPGCVDRPVTAGTATCAISMTAGTTFIQAAYTGDAYHGSSQSLTVSQVVTLVPTTTAIAVAPNPADPGQLVTFTATVTPASVPGIVTFFVDGLVAGGGALTNGQASFSTSTLTPGVHTVSASYPGGTTFGTSASTAALLTVLPPGPTTQFFAEGATGFFQTDIGILNASKTNAATVAVTLLPENGTPTVLQFLLDPLTRRSINLGTVLGDVGGVSTIIESDRPVAAMRQMTWGTPIYGSTLESGIALLSPSWYFAEGATNVFSLFYLIQNPNFVPASVTFTHLLEGGAAPITQTDVVPARSRRTYFINAIPGLEGASLSTVITSDYAIVAERAMYLNTTGRQWEGGTSGRGAVAPSTTWSFAEGATGFFHTYLLLGNANTAEATVTVRYQLPDGTVITKDYAVAPQSRRTIDVNFEDAQLASTSVGMSLTSTQPIVAERTIWWGLPFYEGSVSLGSTETAPTWAIGEGIEGGPANASTFVLVSNGSNTTGTVRLTVVYDDGSRQQKDYTLVANARLTVRVGDDFVLARNARFSVLVESLTAGMPITVETSRYQSSSTVFGEGGGAALATRIR